MSQCEAAKNIDELTFMAQEAGITPEAAMQKLVRKEGKNEFRKYMMLVSKNRKPVLLSVDHDFGERYLRTHQLVMFDTGTPINYIMGASLLATPEGKLLDYVEAVALANTCVMHGQIESEVFITGLQLAVISTFKVLQFTQMMCDLAGIPEKDIKAHGNAGTITGSALSHSHEEHLDFCKKFIKSSDPLVS